MTPPRVKQRKHILTRCIRCHVWTQHKLASADGEAPVYRCIYCGEPATPRPPQESTP